jgi:type IV pilus assembly protein PilB
MTDAAAAQPTPVATATAPTSSMDTAMAVAAPKVVKPRKRIGDMLIEMSVITPEQLNRALSESQATKTPVGSVLVKLGFVTHGDLGKALASMHGLQYVEGKDIELDPAAMRLLPEDFIKRHLVLPYRLHADTRRLEVIMARPDDVRVLDEISLVTGLRILPRVSTHIEIMTLLGAMDHKQTSSDDALAKLETEVDSTSMYAENNNAELEAEMTSTDAPIVQLVNALLMEAVTSNASDIHIEPQKERLLVRFRIDGILKEVKSIPKKMAAPVVSRIKVASGMDIAERRRPQDGRMKLQAGMQQVDMRVNCLAVQFGEKVVIRLLKPNATTGGLEKLGLPTDDIKKLNKMIRAPHGIILVTGPTGSGKTTTLYSCLREINTPELNISTIEDPIEYPLAGINQTQVAHKAGLTFSACLRALLRQDPDVIMVGEIRDKETLEAAIHASLTGHLVFSTVHTNSTAKTVARLLEMGAPSYLVSTSVIGIVAQRLVRRLCPHCKEPYTPTAEELELMGLADAPNVILHRAKGCVPCGDSGYQGRVGLYEIMSMNSDIEQLIDAGASAFSIQEASKKAGMVTLGMDGKRKIAAGLTSIEEVARVLGLDF